MIEAKKCIKIEDGNYWLRIIEICTEIILVGGNRCIIYIYGACEEGSILIEKLEKTFDTQVHPMGYIDSRKKGYINKYPIISPDDVEKNSIIVIAPQFQERVIDIYNEIKKEI